MTQNVKDKKLLIVNADDFGLSKKVNDGIIYSHEHGIVTSASIMTNMPAFEHAVYAAKKSSKLNVGLHVTLTCGSPVSPIDKVKSLVKSDGTFLSMNEFLKRYFLRRIKDEEILLEVENQLKKGLASNLKITHINCHHHLQALYKVYTVVYNIALKHKIKFMRIPISEKYLQEYMMTLENVKRIALLTLARHCVQKQHPTGVDYPNNVFGLTEIYKLPKKDVIVKIIAKCEVGLNELVCHPGYLDNSISGYDSYTNREAEIAVLTSNEVKEALVINDVTLI